MNVKDALQDAFHVLIITVEGAYQDISSQKILKLTPFIVKRNVDSHVKIVQRIVVLHAGLVIHLMQTMNALLISHAILHALDAFQELIELPTMTV